MLKAGISVKRVTLTMTIWEISEKADYIAQGIVAYRTCGTSTVLRWFRDHVIESAPASRHELRADKELVSSLNIFAFAVTLENLYHITSKTKRWRRQTADCRRN